MGRMDGHGEFLYPDGTRYVGEFANGMFHGKGKMITKDGVYASTWARGREVPGRGTFTFNDDLDYARKDWGYCGAKDRRFNSEALGEGPRPAGEGQLVDRPPHFRLPIDCYDTGDGYFDPEQGKIFDYEAMGEDGARVVVRDPTSAEVEWMTKKCRMGTL